MEITASSPPALVDPTMQHEELIVSVTVHSQGVQFGPSAREESIMSVLVNNQVPRQQLNSFHKEDSHLDPQKPIRFPKREIDSRLFSMGFRVHTPMPDIQESDCDSET